MDTGCLTSNALSSQNLDYFLTTIVFDDDPNIILQLMTSHLGSKSHSLLFWSDGPCFFESMSFSIKDRFEPRVLLGGRSGISSSFNS